MSYVHIKFTKTHDKKAYRRICSDCNKKSVFVAFFENYYGWNATCLRCGRRFIDGEWMPLDFYRYARKNSIEAARKRWNRPLTPMEAD